MLIVPPIPFRRRRKPAMAQEAPPPVAGPVLTAALLVSPEVLRLTFDRAIDIGGFDASQIDVQLPQQPGFDYEWIGVGVAGRPAPQTLDVNLQKFGPPSGTQDRLTASATTGIVAADDGAPWAGVTDLPLPWP
jgi:hypothetical protein